MRAFNVLRHWIDRQRRVSSPSIEQLSLLGILADASDGMELRRTAASSDWRVLTTHNGHETLTLLNRNLISIVIYDRDLSDDWRTMIRQSARSASKPAVILASRVVDQYLWQEVVDNGGYDVIKKPFDTEEVRRTVNLAWTYWKSRYINSHDQKHSTDHPFSNGVEN